MPNVGNILDLTHESLTMCIIVFVLVYGIILCCLVPSIVVSHLSVGLWSRPLDTVSVGAGIKSSEDWIPDLDILGLPGRSDLL